MYSSKEKNIFVSQLAMLRFSLHFKTQLHYYWRGITFTECKGVPLTVYINVHLLSDEGFFISKHILNEVTCYAEVVIRKFCPS